MVSLGCVAGLAAIAVLPGRSGSPEAASPRPPVMVVVLDELPTTALINRSGQISKKRFPNFAKLAREGTWYPNHTTDSNWTHISVPAILSGKYPPAVEVAPVLKHYPNNLFTLLGKSGYRIRAEEAVTQLCKPSLCNVPKKETLNPANFKTPLAFGRTKLKQHSKRPRGDALARARKVRLVPGELTFRHLLLPHHPYNYLPDGRVYSTGTMPPSPWGKKRITVPEGATTLGYEQMMIQTGLADQIIGTIRKRAIQQGVWKEMMLVVLGDHGIEHRRGLFWRVTNQANIGSLAFTPLFIKYPGTLKGGISELATQSVDVLPTIAKALGVTIPAVDGKPISELSADPRPVRIGKDIYSYSQALTKRNQAITYRDRLLGGSGLFKLGPRAELIGRSPAGAPVQAVGYKLDQSPAQLTVTKTSRLIPALISGTVQGVGANRLVAVSVNGRIRGIARVFKDKGRNRFGAMINPSALKPRNSVRVYRIR